MTFALQQQHQRARDRHTSAEWSSKPPLWTISVRTIRSCFLIMAECSTEPWAASARSHRRCRNPSWIQMMHFIIYWASMKNVGSFSHQLFSKTFSYSAFHSQTRFCVHLGCLQVLPKKLPAKMWGCGTETTFPSHVVSDNCVIGQIVSVPFNWADCILFVYFWDICILLHFTYLTFIMVFLVTTNQHLNSTSNR